MGVKWRDYLSRKGLSVGAWMNSNNITSVDGLKTRLQQLGIIFLPDDGVAVSDELARRAAAVVVNEAPQKDEVVVEEQLPAERPKKRRRHSEDQTEG